MTDNAISSIIDAGPQAAARRGRKRLSSDHLHLAPAAPALGQTLQDAVYEQLRNALMVGAFRPGQALSVRSIATILGTSGMPVKDALRRLVAEGVLQALPQSSFVVQTLTARRYMDLIEARIRLETLVASRSAEHAPRSLVRTLKGLNERNRMRPGTPPASGELLQRNFDFHFAIYSASSMPDVCDIIMTAWLRIGPLFSLVEEDLDQQDDYTRHARIVDAIAAKDPLATAAMLEKDIMETAVRIAPKLPIKG